MSTRCESSVTFDPDAQEDLRELEWYLGRRFSQRNAELYVNRIISECESLSLSPNRGVQRGHLRPGTRTVGFEKRVTIVFAVEDARVLILGILYAGRRPLR